MLLESQLQQCLRVYAVAFPRCLRWLTLTHWDKIAGISQTIFWMHFPEWKCMNFACDFIPASIETMARCRPGDKPLSEPMMVSLLTHICVTRPKWVIYEISLTYCSILIPEPSNSPRVHQAWRTLGSTGGAYQGQKRGAERKLKHSFVTSEKDYGIFAVVGTLRIVYCYSSKGGLTCHYRGVITLPMATQISSLSIVCSTVCLGAGQRKHQRPASLAFVRGTYRRPVNFPHNGPVTQKMFLFDDVIIC